MNASKPIGSHDQKTLQHDVIVVGAGLVGAVLALSLRNVGYQVGLVDSRSLASEGGLVATLDQRTTAVSSSSAMILDALGLWSNELAYPIKQIEVSQLGRFGTTRIDSRELNVEALGFVVNNASFFERLFQRISADSGILLSAPAAVTQLEQQEDSVLVTAGAEGRQVQHRAQLVIAVDGSASTVRRLIGMESESHDYDQVAIVTSVETDLDHQGKAYERFTPDGPLAFLPVSPHVSSVVFTVSTQQADALSTLPTNEFLTVLQSRFGRRLGQLIDCGQRSSYPLVFSQSKQSFDRRVLLLGNAARTLHPVAGQGFNLAMRDVGKFIEMVERYRTTEAAQKPDPGDIDLLSRFASERLADQRRTVTLTDGLARIFRGDSRWFSHLRALGLTGLDTVSPLRRTFARTAMGFGTGLPDLRYRS